ncbi:MAG: cytochrome c family protein, partial [Rhizobiales bacterium]|nr:cytochrome c family protein [Hyphomicrobiales bacterium]
MASPSDRSSLKNWLPGVAGVVILFALAGYAGVSQGQREQAPTETAAATTSTKPEAAKPEQPTAKAVAVTKPAAETKTAPAKATQPDTKTAPPASKTAAAPAPAPAASAPAAKVATAPAAPAPAASPHAHGHDMSKMAQAPAAKPAVVAKVASTAVEGDVAHGRQVFKKCQACHSMQPSKNLLGPSLAGIVGTKAGEVANYSFSTAMKQSGITWTPEKLDAYLQDPQKVVPGNKMPFPGLKTDSDRTDVIAFLASSAE